MDIEYYINTELLDCSDDNNYRQNMVGVSLESIVVFKIEVEKDDFIKQIPKDNEYQIE